MYFEYIASSRYKWIVIFCNYTRHIFFDNLQIYLLRIYYLPKVGINVGMYKFDF